MAALCALGTAAIGSATVPSDTATFDANGMLTLPVSEGNWRVTVELGDDRRAASTTIMAEDRRLMLHNERTKKGERRSVSFIVNTRTPRLTPPETNAPGGIAVRLTPEQAARRNWDDQLTLQLLGNPAVRSVRIEAAPVTTPTLFLIGDSMVADQPTEPAASWGQMLPAMLSGDIAVANHAESGASLASFHADLRLAKVMEQIGEGDYLLIQFGHNDQKAHWPQSHADADVAYPLWLKLTIHEARRRGATPVLISSPERRNFDAAGRVKPTLNEYAAAMRQVAAEEGVAFIDLNAASIVLYEAFGPARAPLLFNDAGRDATHYNNWGAYLAARVVADGLHEHVPQIGSKLPPFDPAKPLEFAIDPRI